ncbi:hypothetical protein CDAR_85841 [Caerostris darwini]|uniref:Uncharacterized protein n=1 Tax=Caerostris darwini TaxID=1538125 RepID=A0AAV4MXW6_9ARAC|nr:hypothetical protein CDAR_85841 [Caerostris darwini]
MGGQFSRREIEISFSDRRWASVRVTHGGEKPTSISRFQSCFKSFCSFCDIKYLSKHVVVIPRSIKIANRRPFSLSGTGQAVSPLMIPFTKTKIQVQILLFILSISHYSHVLEHLT